MNDTYRQCFQTLLKQWGEEHRRDFPWRGATPFGVLVSEIMLRRTRAEQVVPVYRRFMARFPAPNVLAEASQGDIDEIVRPLGLAWRSTAFKSVAEALVQRFNGVVPQELNQLHQLPGVGDYVASAVRVFAFDLPATLVDTNTVRVAARYFGFPYNAESRRKRIVREAVEQLHDPTRPRETAYTLLDFASTVCIARRPYCGLCPVVQTCAFVAAGHNE